ncbi:hypothetical protein F511_47720 [Dorcoceras hygrometricum]|uniref:Uncharacterized protein n=1 Tax=Dorcoceras hygrometricum TaxID=472368 RepID=A0A2Z6ZQE5_9LAMI|nr:hypothetical protein F511_47720 [Dorcoceras hygrometricum]
MADAATSCCAPWMPLICAIVASCWLAVARWRGHDRRSPRPWLRHRLAHHGAIAARLSHAKFMMAAAAGRSPLRRCRDGWSEFF